MVKKAGEKEEIFQVSGFNFTKDKLIPDTQYTIRIRAHINNRYGPWTENFVGHTFHKGKYLLYKVSFRFKEGKRI